MAIDKELAKEVMALVALAFRNGPIENIHAGKTCSICSGESDYSHTTDAEMKKVMQNAVDHLYRLLSLRKNDPLRLLPRRPHTQFL